MIPATLGKTSPSRLTRVLVTARSCAIIPPTLFRTRGDKLLYQSAAGLGEYDGFLLKLGTLFFLSLGGSREAAPECGQQNLAL
jgi:hypothetical protein